MKAGLGADFRDVIQQAESMIMSRFDHLAGNIPGVGGGVIGENLIGLQCAVCEPS